MSLRALGSIITRRLSPRGIFQAQALGLASRSRSRSLHTLRDLDIGDGAFGAFAVGGFAALMYFKEDDSAAVSHRKGNWYKDPTIRAMFTDENSNVDWIKYLDYICFRENNPKLTDEELLNMVRCAAAQEKVETTEKKDIKVDESAMRARFEQWIKEYGRSYKSEEEKASRYEAFKVNAITADQRTASSKSGACFAPTIYGDWTKEEISTLHPRNDSLDWEFLFDTLGRLYDEGGRVLHPMEREGGEKLCTEAVKQCYMKLKAEADELEASSASSRGNPKAILLMLYGKARRWLQLQMPLQGRSDN